MPLPSHRIGGASFRSNPSQPFLPLPFGPSHHCLEESGAQSFSQEGLFHGGKVEESPDKGARKLLVKALRVRKNLVLQGSLFQALQYDSLKGGFRVDDPLSAFPQSAGPGRACKGADTAADADGRIDPHLLFSPHLSQFLGNH